MTACGTDYLNKDWISASYLVIYGFFVYLVPLTSICYAYYFILSAVFAHEKNMREQAKKMNVASLRADDKAQSAECKLAKAS
jgi:r-opsin